MDRIKALLLAEFDPQPEHFGTAQKGVEDYQKPLQESFSKNREMIFREGKYPHRRPAWLALRALGYDHLRPVAREQVLAGYVSLRALGIQANFVDVLMLQT